MEKTSIKTLINADGTTRTVCTTDATRCTLCRKPWYCNEHCRYQGWNFKHVAFCQGKYGSEKQSAPIAGVIGAATPLSHGSEKQSAPIAGVIGAATPLSQGQYSSLVKRGDVVEIKQCLDHLMTRNSAEARL